MFDDNQRAFCSVNSRLVSNVLNEVLNGFVVDNFPQTIGMSRSELQKVLAYAADCAEGERIGLNHHQSKAFRNALSETLRELGIEEFHARTGFDFEEGLDVLKDLDRTLD